MRKIIKKTAALLGAGLILLAGGCSEDLMDEINADNHNPSADKVAPKFQITDAIVCTAFSTLGSDYAWYAGSYTEQYFGDGGNVMKQAEMRDPTITAAPSTFNNDWNNTYANLQNIRQIIGKCSPGGAWPEKDILGMAETLWVVNFSTLTLLHGDIPYSEALDRENKTPRLDSQESIYADLLQTCDKAISDLGEAVASNESNAGFQDLLYQGDTRKWLAFAHAVKAQLLLQGSCRYSGRMGEAVAEARKALEAGFEGAWLDIFASAGSNNPWAAMFRNRMALGANGTLGALLEARSDPRFGIYASDLFGTGTLSAPAGNLTLAMSSQQVGGPLWLQNSASPAPLLSKSSLLFIIAEGVAREGEDPTDALREAVRASFAEWYAACGDTALSGLLSQESADAYVATLGEPGLREVMVQKYIATACGETIAAWNDLRRTRGMGEEWIRMLNPNNGSGAASQLPLRLPYGQSDFVSNPNVAAADVNIFTDPVWLFARRERF